MRSKPPAMVVITAHGSIETTLEFLRRGAFDLLTKLLKRAQLLACVDQAQRLLRLAS